MLNRSLKCIIITIIILGLLFTTFIYKYGLNLIIETLFLNRILKHPTILTLRFFTTFALIASTTKLAEIITAHYFPLKEKRCIPFLQKYDNFINKNNGLKISVKIYKENLDEIILNIFKDIFRIIPLKISFYFGFWFIRFFCLEFVFYFDAFYYYLIIANCRCYDYIYGAPKHPQSVIVIIGFFTIIEMSILYYLF